MEVGKAVKETSSAQVSETSSKVTPAAATSGDSLSTLSNELGTKEPVASISVSVSVPTVFVTPTSLPTLPEVSVQTITVEKPPVTVFATLTTTLTVVASDILPSGMMRITDIDSLTTRIITVSPTALATLHMDSTPSPPPTVPKQ
ncbi:hypothetical protein GGI17_002386 [Coemansia sp. S146]|nr:hypothetical protein GGI17_002386 [Coemansia sp. S146]